MTGVLSPLPADRALPLPGVSPWGGSVFKVGSSTQSTNTTTPVSQEVPHGLGLTPKALILWTNGNTGGTFATDYLFGIGFTDGTTTKSASLSNEDGVSPSNSTRVVLARGPARRRCARGDHSRGQNGRADKPGVRRRRPCSPFLERKGVAVKTTAAGTFRKAPESTRCTRASG